MTDVRIDGDAAIEACKQGKVVYDRMGFIVELQDVLSYATEIAEVEHRENVFAQKWDAFVEQKGWDKDKFPSRHVLVNDEKFRKLVFKGISEKYRAAVWMSLSGAKEMKEAAPPAYYESLEVKVTRNPQKCAMYEDVEKDLSRTFPNHKDFKDMSTSPYVDRLRKILLCYSLRNTSVGYCQVCFHFPMLSFIHFYVINRV